MSKPLALLCLTLFVAGLACSIPGLGNAPNLPATSIVATLYSLQTKAAAPRSLLVSVVPPSPAPLAPNATNTPAATQTPLPPLVSQKALCWRGPGAAYPVVSSVKAGTVVVLLGVGSIPGWFIIENPIYHDRCWIEAKNLQIDPNLNLAGLKVFNPPPTPGPTPEPTSTP
jgi:hypothetical protein